MNLNFDLDNLPLYEIHAALIHAIKANSGIGFYNHDQGNVIYFNGADSRARDDAVDSRDKNRMFQLLVAIGDELGDSVQPRVRNWRDFCSLAVESYKASKDGARSR